MSRGSFAPSPRKVADSMRMASATRSALRLLGGTAGECPGDLLRTVALDHVVDFDVVEVLDADAALEALAHFTRVVLEALERRNRALVHLDAIAHDAHPRLPIDDAAPHDAPCD